MNNDGNQKITVPKAASLVARSIRGQIVRGEVEEGEALPNESDLMKIYDVSRPTLREALRILESESLIQVVRGAHGGARVRRPEASVAARYAALVLQAQGATLADVFTPRILIEPAVVRLVAEQRSKSALQTLRALHEEEVALMGDPERFAVAAARFHEALMEQAGSSTLTLIGQLLLQLIESNNRATMARLRGRNTEAAAKNAVQEHAHLLDLLESGDAEQAEAVWRSHMEEAARLTLKSLGSMTVVDLLDD